VVPWRIGMAEKLRMELETQVLPPFLEGQRWYAQKGEPVGRSVLRDYAVWSLGAMSWLLACVEVRECTYFLPLALAWEEEEEQVKALSVATVARVRQQANVGVLADAVADEAFWRQVVKAIGESRTIGTEHGALRFTPTRLFGELVKDEVATLQLGRLHAQSTNTSVMLGERLFIKCYRRIRPGTHPELEVGRYLTEVARFKNCVPLAGTVEYQPKEGEAAALVLLQAFVPNQGDGWSYTLAYLERFIEMRREAEGHEAFVTLIQTLATRTAEMHRAFAMRSGLPAFEPEPFTDEDFEAWRAKVREEAEQTFAQLEQIESAKPFLRNRAKVIARIDACAAPKLASLRTRLHGDYHLGQVLLVNNDFLIIDFEGEPSRPLAEGRRKHTPLRDVAGMLRSFSYARGAVQKRERPQPAFEKLVPALEDWEKKTRNAFLDAYKAAAARSGIYERFDDVRGLLALAELEKALYELRYEIANRPDWIDIPLRGLTRIAEQAEGA
jgi:maltose alpha-D-glucosyltransferase/alpha-amylase